jgi:hypothetical protein
MTGTDRSRTYDTSTDPSRGRIRREVVSALGLLILLFNLVAGTLLSSSANAADAPFLDEIFGDRIVVCTGAGMLVLDADGNPISQNGGVDPLCVFCLPLMQGTADAPVVVAVLEAPLPFVAETFVVVAVSAPTPARLVASTSPRGPPLV